MKKDASEIILKVVEIALYVFLLAPLVMVVATSFGEEAVQTFPPKGFSLAWYAKALAEPTFIAGLKLSLFVAAVATVIATPIGVAAAVAIHRNRFPGRNALQAFLLGPLLVPGIVLGIAILVVATALDVGSATERLLFGHTLAILPYSIRTTLAALTRLDPTIEEAAMLFGASNTQTLFYVTLPAVAPGIIAGAIFGFILSFDEAALSLFLVDVDTVTLPVAIISHVEFNVDPSVTALSAMLILGTLFLTLLIERTLGLRQVLGNNA